MSRYGRMRASFDSESSLVPSPPLSPSRHGHPVYFVQSPSRESTTHDIDSLSQSFSRATPRESPMASPMHKHFKNGSSGSTSFNMATAPKPGSRRVLPHAGAGGAGAAHKKGGYNRAWAPGTILEEEGPEEETKKSLSRCCIFLIAVLFSVAVFFIGALVFWLVTMPHKPKVTVQRIAFQYFNLQDGIDNGGVPTKTVSLNATLDLQLYNPSSTFGYHVEPSEVNLMYLDLHLGTGQIGLNFLQKQVATKYQVELSASTEYLHGAGPSFTTLYQATGTTGVPLQVIGSVQSHAYVVGKMIKSDFSSGFTCNFNFSPNGTAHWKVQQLACNYTS
ncbi:hypothetical protein BDL97_15G098700 [Sphagnum fallax]|nr:hypothetical protein BDL97_15G098700 [Sphagnum fallax]KAH8940612.1 hypothetical protein BDL97_15G098700 [Sphagnum fallax]